MEEKFAMTILDKSTGKLVTRDIRTGEVIAEEGSSVPQYLYSLEMADAICNLVREGHTYKEISGMKGMPSSHLIHSWRSQHPDFARNLKQARRDRASWFHDEAVELIKDSVTLEKDEVAREKFRFDGLMRLSEIDDQDTYGKKTTGHGAAGPTTIVINTGITRQEVIEVQYEQSESNGEDGRQPTDIDGRVSERSDAEIRIGAEIDDGESDCIEGRSTTDSRSGEEGYEEESQKESEESN